jgi:hypothetical protein
MGIVAWPFNKSHTCLAISKWVDSGMLIIIHSMQWSVNCIYSGINLLLPYSTGPQQYSHTYYYYCNAHAFKGTSLFMLMKGDK